MLDEVSWRIYLPWSRHMYKVMWFCHLLHTSAVKHLEITTPVLTFTLYPTGLLLGAEGTQFKLGMGRRLEHHFLPFFLLAFLLSLSATLQFPLILSLWIYRSAQLLDCWTSSVSRVCSLIFLQKICSFLVSVCPWLMAMSNLDTLLSYLVL